MQREARIEASVAALPDYAFGSTSLGWWGVLGFMLIEGMGFVLALAAYFFLLPFEQRWPPQQPPPDLLWGTLFTVVAILSEVPNIWVNRVAHQQRRHAVQVGLWLMVAIGIVLLVLRGFEMTAYNVRWDQNAYGSILWAIVLLHTVHTVTDVFDSGVLAALASTHPMDGRRYSDVSDNALYWHFIVWSWVVLYVVIYWVPRWL